MKTGNLSSRNPEEPKATLNLGDLGQDWPGGMEKVLARAFPLTTNILPCLCILSLSTTCEHPRKI